MDNTLFELDMAFYLMLKYLPLIIYSLAMLSFIFNWYFLIFSCFSRLNVIMIINNTKSQQVLKNKLVMMKRLKNLTLAGFSIAKFSMLIAGFIKIELSETQEDIKDSLMPLFIVIFVAETIQLVLFLVFGIMLIRGLKRYSMVTYRKSKCKV